MNCYVVQPDEELLAATAPESIVADVMDEKADILCLAGVEEGKLVTYAVFSHSAESGNGVWLTYLFTAEAYREQGFATELLAYAEEYLRKKKASDILVRILTEPDPASEYIHFFTKRGYMPLTLTGRCLVYEYRDMLDPGVFQILNEKKAHLPKIRHFADMDRKLVGMLPVTVSGEDQELSCFLTQKDEICGAAIACSYENGDVPVLCIKEIWLNDDARKKGFFLPLLYAATEEAKKRLSETMMVQLFIKDDAALHGLFQMFNPPEQELLVQEYMKSLRTK
ncbi:MAG: GNAT family N-acetyltransferase [Lachnospiraceae bacterium]|nr:GNAT family N-acetyltransferase [Lachnospiraceae bacterium]